MPGLIRYNPDSTMEVSFHQKVPQDHKGNCHNNIKFFVFFVVFVVS